LGQIEGTEGVKLWVEGGNPVTFGHQEVPNKDSIKEICSTVSIFLAHKKRIQLGDKMSGRHGNKGIVSLILPPQDMPYLQDGKPVDVVLNPLGVPSRMNVGQVLETLFGLSAFYSKKEYRIMPFDERITPLQSMASSLEGQETDRTNILIKADLSEKVETSRSLVYGHLKNLRKTIHKGVNPTTLSETQGNQLNWLFDPNNPGKTQVFDGRTGDIFYQPVLVGYSYMFKLIHLVDDKIHARSTGPYSLVTQQPLGGRSKKGGQRLGEMEVWALQGFGSASILQEFLTVKSDEIYSRNHFLFHLMRRNWSSLDKIAFSKTFEKDSNINHSGGKKASVLTQDFSGELSWSATDDRRSLVNPTTQTGLTDPSLSTPSKLPESFRVLVNELHALCLSVYSNLPN
jgi:DNA-directed RNA polymerase beta subunit